MKNFILVIPTVIFLSGCATIFSGTSDNVTIKSVPNGAKVEINGNPIGRTPITTPIKRSLTPPQVQLKLEGYDSRSIALQNSFNSISLFNLFFLPAWLIDAVTGSMMKYDITTYEVDLEQKK